ncbi:MAG: hypothetical protein IPP91_04380 [Betaproteobacteria bacterium]|nr:hypothetical protein [Betaproteobacteria bacterium]
MRTLAIAVALSAACWLGGCTEISQEPGKTYAGKEDQKPYAGDEFKGDKAKWEQSLAARTQKQNDYVRAMAAAEKK